MQDSKAIAAAANTAAVAAKVSPQGKAFLALKHRLSCALKHTAFPVL